MYLGIYYVGTYLDGFTVAERQKQKPILLDINYYELCIVHQTNNKNNTVNSVNNNSLRWGVGTEGILKRKHFRE